MDEPDDSAHTPYRGMLLPYAPLFKEFPKIPRFKRNFVITEKIDGTNACVIVGPQGQVSAQSRTRLITPDDDNFGFAKWVSDNAMQLIGLGEGHHFGEWWGGSVQRGYGLKEKRFSLFNTGRWGYDPESGYPNYPECCHVVPVLYQGQDHLDADIDDALYYLRTYGSKAAPGYMNPEGIVVYHTASRGMFKILLENDEQPKGATA
jgi:hypothetical protein